MPILNQINKYFYYDNTSPFFFKQTCYDKLIFLFKDCLFPENDEPNLNQSDEKQSVKCLFL